MMKKKRFTSLLILCVFFFIQLENSVAIDPYYVVCNQLPRNCGDNLNISFPFYIEGIQNSSCGYPGFGLSCNKDGNPMIYITENEFVIDRIDYQNQTISVHNAAFVSSNSICNQQQQLKNVTLPNTQFNYVNDDIGLYFLSNCTNSTIQKLQDYKLVECGNEYKQVFELAMLRNDENLKYALEGCSENIVVPVEAEGGGIVDYLRRGFEMKWKAADCSTCEESGGRCGFNYTIGYTFTCFCPDRPHPDMCYNKKGKTRIWVWIRIQRRKYVVMISTSVIASVFACGLIAFLCYIRIRRRKFKEKEKRSYIHELTKSDSFNYSDILEKGINDTSDIKIFSFGAILAATDNFSSKNKLGQGGYGPVYKGRLSDGREIAVKRLSKTSGQGIEEFKSELILISKLQHTNLVRLYGCCIHKEEKMLIYEYMPNKSLDFFLFAEDKNEKIDWTKRFNIIEGVAQGLLYLHKYSRMKVIHRDLKVSNVLLDENMNPKIADFGLARIFRQNVTEAITNRVVGTYGYMAPEYAIEGTFSTKSDVFSFGVLILEIVSGKRNSKFYNIDRQLNLVGYAYELWERDAVLELKDEELDESFDLKQLVKTIHIGLLCVQDNADDRPTMLEVISMLNNEITDLPNPIQPIFIIGRKPEKDSSSKKLV